ncbi:hypothetical protein EDC01DRAFT_333941 [Geopyxis carbonaria]|nr:hypothetical protein EDC01DRAFT_333941 [Geopyxis carbonaria]
MNFLRPLLLLVLLHVAVVLGVPVDNTSLPFYLRTTVVRGDASFAGLYPFSYHTGAGTSALTLLRSRRGSVRSYFNGTRLNADFDTSFPWGWKASWPSYTTWSDMSLNGGIGDEGFAINTTRGRGDVTYWGVDWVACEWWYGAPQLFRWAGNWVVGARLPKSCAWVRLVPEVVK